MSVNKLINMDIPVPGNYGIDNSVNMNVRTTKRAEQNVKMYLMAFGS